MITIFFKTNKEKGNAGLSMAIAYFGVNGYTVCIPLNDTQDYDLIVEKDEIMERIQVKTTGATKPSGNYVVTLKSSGGTKGTVYKRVNETRIEQLFVLCGDGTMYLIPFDDMKNNSNSMTLNPKSTHKKYVIKI